MVLDDQPHRVPPAHDSRVETSLVTMAKLVMASILLDACEAFLGIGSDTRPPDLAPIRDGGHDESGYRDHENGGVHAAGGYA